MMLRICIEPSNIHIASMLSPLTKAEPKLTPNVTSTPVRAAVPVLFKLLSTF